MAVTSLLSRATITDAIDGAALQKIKGLVYIPAALSGAVTLGPTYPQIIKLDPGGAHRDVTLDALATSEGLYRRIVNAADAAENLVCKNVAGDTIGTINQNEQGEFYCDGATWSLIAISSIALS
jgi:hypothetical protein